MIKLLSENIHERHGFVKISKKDIIIIGTIVVAGILLYVGALFTKSNGNTVVIYVDGKEYAEYSLEKDGKYIIDRDGVKNVVVIEDGVVKMESASCDNQICVKHKCISKDGESIICLPNKVVVEVRSEKNNDIDSVAD